MKILVTGATGFIGQHLIPLLLSSGHQVVATSKTLEKGDVTARNNGALHFEIDKKS